MATLDSVQNPGISEEVDPSFRAGRISLRPLEYTTLQGKILGHYSIVGTSAASAFAAASNQFAARWADPTNFMVLMRLWASLQVVTAVTAQSLAPLMAFIARGYTIRDATGATALAVANPNTQKLRSTMGTTLFASSGNIDVGSLAAGVTAGTKTVDANPIGFMGLPGIGALGTGAQADLYKWDKLGGHPIVLAQNEGIVVQNTTLFATGTVSLTVGMEWAEVAAF
jgi:hypothetical protein